MTKVYFLLERDALDEYVHSISGAWLDRTVAEKEQGRRNGAAPYSRRFDLEELELIP